MKARHLMPFLVGTALADNYYFDAVVGSETGSGTFADPWRSLSKYKTLDLLPGDSVLLKRGAAWNGDSIFIFDVGTAEQPIVFSAYGDKSLAPPHVQGNLGFVVVMRDASHVILENWTLSKARGGCIEMADSTTSHILVQHVEAFDCGGCIYMTGTDITVRWNHFRDGHMVVNTPDSVNDNDDYGATGIGFSQLDGCQVYGNRLTGLHVPSYDYGEDGGALEFWKTVRNCDVWGNFSYDNNGFSEFGGQAGDTVHNVLVHHNIIIDSDILGGMHLYSSTNTFGIGYDSLHFDHNLIVSRFNHPYGYFMFATGDSLGQAWRVKVRNNILVSDSLTYFSYQPSGQEPSYFHSGNLLWSPEHDFWNNGVTPGVGDSYGDPLFQGESWDLSASVDTAILHYSLSAESPAVGVGENLGYTKDFFGNPLPQSGLVDLGPLAVGSIAGIDIGWSPRVAQRLSYVIRVQYWNLLGQARSEAKRSLHR